MKTYILTEEQRELVGGNMKLIPFALNRYFGHEIADDEDMVSIASLGLCRAASTYDPSLGTTFSTYAVKCIVMAVRAHFRAQSAQHRSNGLPCASLNYMVDNHGDDDPVELIDLIKDDRVNVEEEVTVRIFYEQARQYVPTFAMIHDQCITAKEACKKLHISRAGLYFRMKREFRIARRKLFGSSLEPTVP